MNALLWQPSKLDAAVLWLCVLHSPQSLTSVASCLGRPTTTIGQNFGRLRRRGYLDSTRASCIPTPKGLDFVRSLKACGANPLELVRGKPLRRRIGDPPDALCRVAGELHTLANDAAAQACPYWEDPPSVVARREVEFPALAVPPARLAAASEPGPELSALVSALASAQDPLLAQANAQLRLRVTELEERVRYLEARAALTLERLAQAADALTT